MGTDSILFVLRPDSETREFLPAYVVRDGQKSVKVRFDDDVAFEKGDEIVAYRRAEGEFVQCAYRVARVVEEAEGTHYRFLALGEAIPDDARGSRRVPAVYESMLARFGEEEDCVLLDISEDGIALIASEEHAVDETLPFEMWIRDGHYVGVVTVRSVERTARDRFRYGLVCEEDTGEDNLKASLSMIWIALQVKFLEISDL